MRFLLSKLFSFFLMPANWIILLGIAALLIRNKKWKKGLLISFASLLIIFSNPFLFKIAYEAWQIPPPKSPGNLEAVILPGGLSGYDKNNIGYFNQSADRFIQAANLFHQGKAQYVLITGGNGRLDVENPPEAWFLKDELIRNGIPAEKIIVEDKSRNTKENAVFSRVKVDSMRLKGPFFLSTSDMHMRRCQLEFSKAGMNIVPYPCNYEVLSTRGAWYSHLWPDVSVIASWGRLIKEWIGYAVSKFA